MGDGGRGRAACASMLSEQPCIYTGRDGLTGYERKGGLTKYEQKGVG